MRSDDIKKRMRAQPFRPFRVFISDGSSYDVRHPEFIYVARTEVIIGLDPGDDVIPDESVYAHPIHITGIKPINGKRRANGKRK